MIIFYNAYQPYTHLLLQEIKSGIVEPYNRIISFVDACKSASGPEAENTTVILPLQYFDIAGYDIREAFYDIGRNRMLSFVLIGTPEQIEFSLTQNSKFLKNDIDTITLPLLFDVLEKIIQLKVGI